MVPLRPAAGLARGGTSRLEDTLELKIFEGEECLVGDGSAENQSGKSLQKAPLGNRLCKFGGTIHEINYPKQHCLVSFISATKDGLLLPEHQLLLVLLHTTPSLSEELIFP